MEFAPFVRNSPFNIQKNANFINKGNKQELKERIKVTLEKQQNSKPVLVHKDNGFFDTKDFTSFSAYGADFLIQLQQFSNNENMNLNNILDPDDAEDIEKIRQKKSSSLDLIQIFMQKNSLLHVLRTIEPSLFLRYHQKYCDPLELKTTDLARCLTTQKRSLGTKTQLANLVFTNDNF